MHRPVGGSRPDRPAARGEHPEHRPVARQYLRLEARQAAVDGDSPEVAEEPAGDAEALVVLLDDEGHLGGARTEAGVARRGDDHLVAVLSHRGDQRHAAVEIDLANPPEVRFGHRHLGPEETRID
jgi:hypothetical protein